MPESSRTKFDYVRGYTSFVSDSNSESGSGSSSNLFHGEIDINCFRYLLLSRSHLTCSSCGGPSLKQFMWSIKLLLKVTKAKKKSFCVFVVFNFHKFHLNVFLFFFKGEAWSLYHFYNNITLVRLMCQVFYAAWRVMKMITRFYDD